MTPGKETTVHPGRIFRALHESGCFVIPNPWNAGTAKYLQHLGFKALATKSGGYAFSRGLADPAVARDDMLSHIREIVRSTDLPVNADYQSGYADDPDEVAANVKRCVETGVAGLSIEDATGRREEPLYERSKAIARIRAARRALDDSGVPVLLTARCEAWLVRDSDPLHTALDRLAAFADAGADCLFAPGVTDERAISQLVNAVAPKPLNVLVSSAATGLSVSRLAELGVRRVSVGSSLARVAWGAFIRSARDIAERGSFESFAGAPAYSELNNLFSGVPLPR